MLSAVRPSIDSINRTPAELASILASQLQVLMNIRYLLMEQSEADPEKLQTFMQMGNEALRSVAKSSRRSRHPVEAKGPIKGTLKTTRLARLTKICLQLPYAELKDKGRHAAFVVGEEVFAYYLSNYHGDGVIGICCKARLGEDNALIANGQAKWYVPFRLGLKGWIGLRIDESAVDWGEVSDLIFGSYLQACAKAGVSFGHAANVEYRSENKRVSLPRIGWESPRRK